MANKKARNYSHLFKNLSYLFVTVVFLLSHGLNTYAAVDDFIDKFAANNISRVYCAAHGV